MDQPRVLIAVPHLGTVDFNWAIALNKLVVETMKDADLKVGGVRKMPVDLARCLCIEHAKKEGFTHVFFLDSDVIVPPDGLAILLAYKLQVMAGIYAFKDGSGSGVKLVNKASSLDYINTSIPLDLAGKVSPSELSRIGSFIVPTSKLNEKCNFPYTHPDILVGAGCLLIDMKVFDQLEKPYFKLTSDPEHQECNLMEDFYFCLKLRDAGISIHVAPTVQCLHLDERLALDAYGRAVVFDGNMPTVA